MDLTTNSPKIKLAMHIWQYTSLDRSQIGGVEKHIQSVSQALVRQGHRVHIGTDTPHWWNEKPDARRVVHTHGGIFVPPKSMNRNWAQEGVLWIHVAHGTSIARLLACGEYLSLSGWRGTVRDMLPARFSDAVIAVSDQVSTELRRYFRIHSPIRVISNGADPNIFKPLKAIAENSRLAFVGRGNDRVKNTEQLIAACRMVHNNHADFELMAIPGLTSHNEPFLKNSGQLESGQVAAALAECRALVLCSLYESDGIVLREAQAMGLPVIASDLPSIRQNLGDYRDCYFVNPRSAGGLASAIEKALYTSPAQTPSPRIRSWEEVAAEFSAFYDELSLKTR